MAHHLRIDRVGSTLTKGEIIDSIKQIGLTHAILPDETIHFGRELQIGLFNVLIV
jgi:hypothetical protein